MKTMNIKSTDYRVQSTESGSVPGSVLAAIRKASVLCTLCSVLLISSCTHDEIIPPTPLAPQGTKTVTVDFQLPEGKPGFGEVETRATTTDGTWAEGDELLMKITVKGFDDKDGYAVYESYMMLAYDSDGRWDMLEDKSTTVTENSPVANPDYVMLAQTTDIDLTQPLSIKVPEDMSLDMTIVSVTYAPELEWNITPDANGAVTDVNRKLKATATTTAPECWEVSSGAWSTNQARLRVHTGAAGDVVTLTSEKFYPNSIGKSADGIYTATTDADGNAYFYGEAGTIDDSDRITATTSGFNLSLTTVTVGEGDAASTCPIAPVTLLKASTLVPVQLEAGKSYCLDATEKRPDTESFAVIDGTSGDEALQTAIDAGKTTLYVTGEEVDYIGSAISNSGAAEGSINLILADATAIGDAAFYGCSALKSVSAPKATSIGEYAFYECSALKSVSAPAATTIGGYAFTRCSALTSVSLPAAETIVEYAFEGCTALKSVSLPDVTKIGMYAFSSCTSLTSVSLPAATSIGNEAFYGCAALESVSLPAAKTIGINAFQACADLTSVSLPAAETIGNGAFFECSALTSVSAPKATSIGGSAFWSCDALTSLTFGSVIETVGANAFYSVPTTTTCDLTLNSGQLSSTDLAPSGNTWAGKTWASIRYVDDEGNAVTVIDGAATDADAVTAQISAALAAGQSTIYVAGTTLESAVKEAIKAQADGSIDLVLPDATSIGQYSFDECKALTSVSAPKATIVGINAFYSCTALTSVSLPAATSIGSYAFTYCNSLVSVSLPAATGIGQHSFEKCKALTSVSAPKATNIEAFAFSECTALTILTFGTVTSVIYNVLFGINDSSTSTTCDLTLGAGSIDNPEAGENKTWAGYTWKSITLVNSN